MASTYHLHVLSHSGSPILPYITCLWHKLAAPGSRNICTGSTVYYVLPSPSGPGRSAGPSSTSLSPCKLYFSIFLWFTVWRVLNVSCATEATLLKLILLRTHGPIYFCSCLLNINHTFLLSHPLPIGVCLAWIGQRTGEEPGAPVTKVTQ